MRPLVGTAAGRSGPTALIALTALTALTGCWGNEPTVFPDGLAPLSENTAPAPTPVDGDAHPEQLVFARGEKPDYAWSHGRGFVKASLKDTWDAMRVRGVSVDRRKVARWSVTEGVEEGYDDSYRIHNEVESIIDVWFDTTWRHGAVEGSVDAPEVVAVRWQKTDGTVFIAQLTGSIVATQVDDGVTELAIIEHLEGSNGAGHSEIESFLTDYFASVLAVAHGQPLPEY